MKQFAMITYNFLKSLNLLRQIQQASKNTQCVQRKKKKKKEEQKVNSKIKQNESIAIFVIHSKIILLCQITWTLQRLVRVP